MDASLLRLLSDKLYDKRKAAALELEKVIARDAALADEGERARRLESILGQLRDLTLSSNVNAKHGGLMGLAGASLALPEHARSRYLFVIVPLVIVTFGDQDKQTRYYAAESMYNIAKAAKGEILIFFNELFDALSRLSADVEVPVKNGAELVDRLLKDIVTEQAGTYVAKLRIEPPYDTDRGHDPRAFSLARFVPLLRERIGVLNTFTRMFLVSWLAVLDSVPDLDLVAYLPDFLDGLLKYLGDGVDEVRTATQNLLAEFLKEIREIADVECARAERVAQRRLAAAAAEEQRRQRELDTGAEHSSALYEEDESADAPDRAAGETSATEHDAPATADTTAEDFAAAAAIEDDMSEDDDEDDDYFDDGASSAVVGQGVEVDHAAIVEILLHHLSAKDSEVQATCMRWIADFLQFAQGVMVPFTARLIPVVLSAIAHENDAIREAAREANKNLFDVVQELPDATNTVPHLSDAQSVRTVDAPRPAPSSPASSTIPFPTPASFPGSTSASSTRLPSLDRSGQQAEVLSLHDAPSAPPLPPQRQPHSRRQSYDVKSTTSESTPDSVDPIDYAATVSALVLQFLSRDVDTRLEALRWLTMLQRKAPKKVLSMSDGTFPTLLQILSDPSEDVVRADLHLLAQVSATHEDEFFTKFMFDLLGLFATDRKLLETRGSLIIRELCARLNTERIYRTFAEILEKHDDLEQAANMVQNLNLILVTTPDMNDFRKRLRALDTRDGQTLFVHLFRSWSHNPVATFTLCLLAQAYEQAFVLLQIFAELEITVSLLTQLDKLVQLLESPVFSSLRLQLLDPDKYPYLLKALYGILMLLPQSTAFVTLRNRLNAGSAHAGLLSLPKAPYSSAASGGTRTGLRREPDIKWNELYVHFRQVQGRHERARRFYPNLPPVADLPPAPTPQQQRTESVIAAKTPAAIVPARRQKGGNEKAGSVLTKGLRSVAGLQKRRQPVTPLPAQQSASSQVKKL